VDPGWVIPKSLPGERVPWWTPTILSGAQLPPLRILIADDHDGLRHSVRSLLSSQNSWLICGAATDGIEAVNLAKRLLPDVVLMDVSMPGMDWFKATRIIRRDVPSAKVIIVSQNDPAIGRRHALEADAQGYVEKANLGRDLIQVIEQVTQPGAEFKSLVSD
jgi:DNA-binding NarL/FixJ family response regulator